jgi:peptidoglycan/LPS O-acetylase OafA/YrhL
MTHGHRAERSRRQLLGDAAVTLATVLLAFAAFDDITTDTATTFTSEWVGLAVCGAWLLIVSWRLLGSGHLRLGSISVVALVAAVGAGSAIRPGTGPFQIEYLTTIAGLLWFLGLAGILTRQAGRGPINTRPNPAMEPTARVSS